MRDQVARIQFDLDFVPSLAHLHPPPDPGDRNRVTDGVHRDISLHVYRALSGMMFQLMEDVWLTHDLSKNKKVGIHLTPVATTCSMAADGRFSAGSDGI